MDGTASSEVSDDQVMKVGKKNVEKLFVSMEAVQG